MLILLTIGFAFGFSFVSVESLCPQKVAVVNFNISGIGHGIWYEVAKYPNSYHNPNKFLTYRSRMLGDLYIAETINVNRTSPYYSEVFSVLRPDADGKGKMSFTFNNPDRGHLIESPVMYILAADYDKYFVPYTCVHDVDRNKIQEYGWILSRSKPVIGESKEEFIEIGKRAGLDEEKLIWYDQETNNI